MVKSIQAKHAQHLAQAYYRACLSEIEAIKPGNVHVFADGHGMVVGDFIQSAEASMHHLVNPQYGLGERIYHAFEATWQVVNMNTNLGILLLCAPIVHAVLHGHPKRLQAKVADVLAQTTQEDADYVFAAIRLAHPAGLGTSARHDVHAPADCTLLQAMQFAALRDSVALQYRDAFHAIFTQGLTCYQQHLQRWSRPAWATTAMYLYWLGSMNDSHVQRKYGQAVAEQLRMQAQTHFKAFSAQENPKLYLPSLLAFDKQLKCSDINPGTSADLTVVTLMVASLIEVYDN